MMVFWLALTFFSVGLFAPANRTAVGAQFLAALAVSGAIFLPAHKLRRAAPTQAEFQFRRASADAKLVCINLQAYTTTQVPDRDDILPIGGFSDAVFQVVAAFFAGDASRFVSEVEAIEV